MIALLRAKKLLIEVETAWLGGGTANPPTNGAKNCQMLLEGNQEQRVGCLAVWVQVFGRGEEPVRP